MNSRVKIRRIVLSKRSKIKTRISNFLLSRKLKENIKKIGAKNTQRPSSKKDLFKINSTSFLRLSVKEQTFFAKRLAFLIKAGVPILESLSMIREQTSSNKFQKILDHVIKDVANGQSLSKSLSRYKKVFGEFAINIIHVGESTGILSENLEYLADELKKKYTLRKKLIGSFVYPAVVTVATLGITAFLMVYLFPKIMPVFDSLHIQLPITTRAVIYMSKFLQENGIYLIIGIIVAISAFIIAINRSYKIKTLYHSFTLKIPIFGEAIRQYHLANSSRTLGLLLKSGITLSEALPITSHTTSNTIYKKEFEEILKSVNRGEKISNHLNKRRKLFPDILGQIVSVGERSGNLPNSLIYLSELYESEVEEFTKNLSSLIEPVLMLIMGLLVGFIAISIITPIYSITSGLHP